MVHLKDDFQKNQQTTKCMKNYPGPKGLNPLSGKPLINCGRLNMSHFVRGTMSHAKASFHWSVIPYQVTFE